MFATAASPGASEGTASPAWTYWPVWPSFLPIVQESLRLAVGGRWDHRNTLVGRPLSGSVHGVASSMSVNVATPPPEARVDRVRSAVVGDETNWTYDDTDYSGAYAVELGPPAGRTELFAVNVDTMESDLAKIASDELPEGFAVVGDAAGSADRGTIEIARRSGLHERLLYGVLGLLLCETLLALWFGRRAA
jgi:hypothetical protein